MVLFDRPGFFLLLPFLLGALILARRGALTTWTRRQALICLLVRSAIAILVCLALAGPRLTGETRDVAVVFLRDISASVEHEASRWDSFLKEAGDQDRRSASAVFAAEPQVVRAFGSSATVPGKTSPDASNLQAALEFAGAMLPADRPGRIVLLSDGVWTAGRDPVETASALAVRGVEIDVVPAQPETRPEVGVVRLDVPPGVRVQEVFDLSATVHASVRAPGARLRLYQNHLLVSEIRRDLVAGDNAVVFPNVRASDGLGLYEVEVVAEADTRAENNRKKVGVAHGGAPKVLIVDSQPEQT